MKLKHTRAIVALTLATICAPALADGAINGQIGGRRMNDQSYWSPLEDQISFAVMADVAMSPAIPVWLSASGAFSTDSSGNMPDETSAEVAELTVGLKLMPLKGVARPYIGVGALRNWTRLTAQSDNVSDSAASRGWYVDGGAQFWIGRHFDIALNLRWVKDTRVVLFNRAGDVDGKLITIGAGFTWGAEPPRHHQPRAQAAGR